MTSLTYILNSSNLPPVYLFIDLLPVYLLIFLLPVYLLPVKYLLIYLLIYFNLKPTPTRSDATYHFAKCIVNLVSPTASSTAFYSRVDRKGANADDYGMSLPLHQPFTALLAAVPRAAERLASSSNSSTMSVA